MVHAVAYRITDGGSRALNKLNHHENFVIAGRHGSPGDTCAVEQAGSKEGGRGEES